MLTKNQVEQLLPGTQVTYTPGHGVREFGIVKKPATNPNYIFVVYQWNDDPDNYHKYTAARTRKEDLIIGWQ